MNRQIFLIFIVLAFGVFGTWQLLILDPSHSGNGNTRGTVAKSDTPSEDGAHEPHDKEGHVELGSEALKNAELGMEVASPAKIRMVLPLYGKIVANEEATVHIMPRYPGIVKQVYKRLGDQVIKGETLALVESNESLQSYEIKSELTGTVTRKEVTLGELVKGENPIFVVSDLSNVWVDLNVFRRDFPHLKKGQAVEIHLGDGSLPVKSTVSYLSPFGAETTQTLLARAIIPNESGDLRPGLFVDAEIVLSELVVPVAVKVSALHTVKEKTVIFIWEENLFELREVKIGVQDGENAEVISGLVAGAQYASTNSFLLKAELGKEEAAHEH